MSWHDGMGYHVMCICLYIYRVSGVASGFLHEHPSPQDDLAPFLVFLFDLNQSKY